MNLQICNNNYGKHANIYYEQGTQCPLCMILDKHQMLESRINSDLGLLSTYMSLFNDLQDRFTKLENFIHSIHPEINY